MPPKKSTIYDISALAEVSIATVSRVVNNDPSVREKTKTKVLEAMNKLRYRPSQSAKAMAEKRDLVSVGVLYRFASSGYFSDLIAGIDEGLIKHKCLMMASRLVSQPSSSEEIDRYIRASGIQALILLYPDLSEDLLSYIECSAVPIVIVSEHVASKNIYQVNIEHFSGLNKIINHLITKFRRHSLIIHGPLDNQEANERLQITKDILAQHRISHECKCGEFDANKAKEILEEQIKSPWPKTGLNIICHNDAMALAVLAVAYENGLKVPDQLAVTGFDNIDSSAIFNLSTIAVPSRNMGERAAKMCINLLKYEDVDHVQQVKTQAILRKTI
jgi:DNA-binding LacI/PurR family transcriptional regulator